MKVVKSADQLQRLALSRGASASIGAEKFNSTANKIAPARPEKVPEPAAEAPKPEPKAAPAVDITPAISSAIESMSGYAASAVALGESNNRVLESVQKTLDKLATVPDSPSEKPESLRKWRLTAVRDTRTGLLDYIDAVQIA